VNTLLCAWCRRDGRDVSAQDGAAIVGLCEDHIRRFTAEVDAALEAETPVRSGSAAGPERTRRASSRSGDALVKRVADVLVDNARVDLCDACIAREIGHRVVDVKAATERLASSSDFLRDLWRCGRCGTRQMVTRARSRLLRSRSVSPSSAA
jgi:hypothetical protein